MTQTVYTSTENVPLRVFVGVRNPWTLQVLNDDGTEKDLTGYTFYGQVRDKPGGRLLAEFTIDDSYLSTGVLPVELTKADSEAIGINGGVYDILQVEDADETNVLRLFGGDVTTELVATEIAA